MIAVFVTNDGTLQDNVYFVIYYKRIGALSEICYLNTHSDPMLCPLLFPCADSGWILDQSLVQIRSNRQVQIHTNAFRRVTEPQLSYNIFCYHLAVRYGLSILHASCKLIQRYIVADNYVKV